MDQGARARRGAPGAGPRPTRGWDACSSATARWSARARPSRPAGRHAEAVALDAAGERARGATAYVTLEPCAHHGRTPAVRRRAGRRGRHAGSSSRSRTPTRWWRAPGSRGLRAARCRRRRSARAPTTPPAISLPYLVHRRLGRAATVVQAGHEPRRAHRGGRRVVAVDHRRPRPAPTCTACAPSRRRWSSGSGTALADRPVAHRSRRRRAAGAASPSACCSTARGGSRPTGRCSTPRSRRPSCSPPRPHRTPRSAAWRAAGAEVARPAAGAGRRRRRPRRRPRAPRRSAACSRRWSSRARRSPASLRRRRPRRPSASSTSAPTLLGVDGRPGVRRRRPRHRRRRRRAGASSTSRALGDDVRLEYERGTPDVHRHRRGARHRARGRPPRGRRPARDRGHHGARRRRARRVDRGERVLPHRRRAGRGLVGRRRGHRDAAAHVARRRSPRATR